MNCRPASDTVLEPLQHLLARLYTDESLRQRFDSDPHAVAREIGLGDEFVDQLTPLLPRIASFADSLHRKRMTEARSLLPMTSAALGPAFGELFLSFATTCQPTGDNKPLADAVAFGDWLLRVGLPSTGDDAWKRDVIRFENLTRRTASRAFGLTARAFRHAIHEYRPDRSVPEPPRRRWTLVIWWTFRGATRVVRM